MCTCVTGSWSFSQEEKDADGDGMQQQLENNSSPGYNTERILALNPVCLTLYENIASYLQTLLMPEIQFSRVIASRLYNLWMESQEYLWEECVNDSMWKEFRAGDIFIFNVIQADYDFLEEKMMQVRDSITKDQQGIRKREEAGRRSGMKK